MLGMGSGQPNRRESLRIAFKKAGEDAMGAALASDAFFPLISINFYLVPEPYVEASNHMVLDATKNTKNSVCYLLLLAN